MRKGILNLFWEVASMRHSANMTAKRIGVGNKEMDHLDSQHLGKGRDRVRSVAREVLQTFGHRNNIYDIKLDGQKWTIYYEDTLPFKERPSLEELIAEQLQISVERVKLVGIGSH